MVDMHDLLAFRAFIGASLTEAAGAARRYYGKATEAHKEGEPPAQVLTEADLEIGALLTRRVLDSYPNHNVIDEELGVVDNGSDHTWVIDPIDGTSNFAAGLPHFGIQIGLLVDDRPVAAGIHLPAFDELVLGVRGGGCTINDGAVRASTATSLLDVLVAYGIDGHPADERRTIDECAQLARLLLRIRNVRSSNSAYDAVQTARGAYGGWVNRTTKIWDQVPQHLLLEEAGCRYTDLLGRPLDYHDALRRTGDNFEHCAAPAPLHEQILDALATACS